MLTTSTITTFITLVIACIILLIFFVRMANKKSKQQIELVFVTILGLLLFWILCLILQLVFVNFNNANPIYFDYFVYISACNLPVLLLIMSLVYTKTKIKFSKKYGLLFIIPTLSLILLWTNDFHHLFYVTYSTNLSETVTGPWVIVHSIYSYGLIAISAFLLINSSSKNASFFSKQTVLIVIGVLVPVVVNGLGTFNIINMSIYITPISFTATVLCYALAIFKFGFLKVAPIALQRIVDRISDSYIVLNDAMIITDFNKTLLDTFSLSGNDLRNMNFIDLIENDKKIHMDIDVILKAINKTMVDDSTYTLEQHFEAVDKYFHIEINSIKNNNTYLGTLILLKDITQHTKDMETIKENQEVLVEKERLASLGQMIGGIAHNLKTPIMSISGAAEGLSDLTNEYRESVGDPEVTVEDHHAIANDMDEWIAKIRTHLSYMSDIITAVKGQAVAFSDNMINGFTVGELVKHVDILMKHELKNALITMNTNINLDENTLVGGNINSLVQVINNIISNAIQAYNGKENESINFNLDKKGSKLAISIEDFAGGLPKNVQEKMFKEMVTTKGKNGTGLGMFMSYSNIKAHFNGNMTYKTEQGKGTTFFIEIPLAK